MRFIQNARFFAKLIRIKALKSRLPLSVIFNVTNSCNCHCRHCYAAYYNRQNSKELTAGEIKKIIWDLRRNGCERISFSGGEPLLRKDIGELVDYVNVLGMSAVLNSNGIEVPRHIPTLRKLDSLVISLDGRPEHHNQLRGEQTAQKALEGIKSALDNGVCVFVNTVLNKYNLDDVDYMLDLAKKLGFRVEFNLAISNIFGNQDATEQIKPTNQAYLAALKYIAHKKSEGAPILFSRAAYESVLNTWDDFALEQRLDDNFSACGNFECPAGKFFCLIDSDGTLWACPHLIEKIDSRNVLEVGFASAWQVAGKHRCRGCYQVYHHEFSLLTNLNLQVIWNYLKTSLGGK